MVDSHLAEQAENALIAFLRAEIALGFTFLSTAGVEKGLDDNGVKRATQLVKGALETIERFRSRISDPAIQEELQQGAAEIQKRLSSLVVN